MGGPGSGRKKGSGGSGKSGSIKKSGVIISKKESTNIERRMRKNSASQNRVRRGMK